SSAVLGMTSPEAVVCAAWSDLATTRASRGLMEPDMRLTLSGRDVTLREFLGSGPDPDRRRGAERGGSLRQPLALSAVDCQRGNCRTSAGTHARRVLNRGASAAQDPAPHLAPMRPATLLPTPHVLQAAGPIGHTAHPTPTPPASHRCRRPPSLPPRPSSAPTPHGMAADPTRPRSHTFCEPGNLGT